MALAMQSNMASAQDADLMDIDIDMDLDEHVATLNEEFQLEVQEPVLLIMTQHTNWSPTGRRRTIICTNRRTSS